MEFILTYLDIWNLVEGLMCDVGAWAYNIRHTSIIVVITTHAPTSHISPSTRFQMSRYVIKMSHKIARIKPDKVRKRTYANLTRENALVFYFKTAKNKNSHKLVCPKIMTK